MKHAHIGGLYGPSQTAEAAHVPTATLRGWSGGTIKGLSAPLAFLGETGANGRRMYSLADVVLVRLVARQSGADGGDGGFMQTGAAVDLANSLAPLMLRLDAEFALHGNEALVKMGEARPLAFCQRGYGDPGATWKVALEPRAAVVEWFAQPEPTLPAAAVFLDIAALWGAASFNLHRNPLKTWSQTDE